MVRSYNEVAGRSAECVGALSDGIFAFAKTLLSLDLRGPAMEAFTLKQACARLLPRWVLTC